MTQNLELISILKPYPQNTDISYGASEAPLACQVHCKGYECVPPSPVPLVTLGSKTFGTLRLSFKRGCGTNHSSQGFRAFVPIHADESSVSSGTVSRGRLCWPWAVSLQGGRLLSRNLLGCLVGQGVKAT